MVTARLNRLFTVQGRSAESTSQPIKWGFNMLQNVRGVVGVAPLGSYNFFSVGNSIASQIGFNPNTGNVPGTLTSKLIVDDTVLIVVGRLSVEADGTPQAVPDISDHIDNASVGKWVRYAPGALAQDVNYIQWSIARVDMLPSSFIDDDQRVTPQEYLGIWVTGGALMGDAFSVDNDHFAQFWSEGQNVQVPVESGSKQAFGQMRESENVASFVRVGGDLAQEVIEARATLLMRYDETIAVGVQVTDDLGRIWNVTGSRAISDRRFLEFDLTRIVGDT